MTENTNEPTTTTLVLLHALKMAAGLAAENFDGLPIASPEVTRDQMLYSLI